MMTDNEIIKALECCISSSTSLACFRCPMAKNKECNGSNTNINKLVVENALDLINRQKADKEALIKGQESLMKCIAKKKETIAELDKEVENLAALNKELIQDLHTYHDFKIKCIKRAKSEAIKEFAEKLKKEATVDEDSTWWIANIDVDNLVKEMAGE